jgi:hypothetical protein
MELLRRFVQGDVEAFETQFRQFQGDVYGWIVRIVRDSGSQRTCQWRRSGGSGTLVFCRIMVLIVFLKIRACDLDL